MMRTLKAGTRVRLKVPTIEGTKGVGTLMHDVIGDGFAEVMMDGGPIGCMGHELEVLRDQLPGPAPMRGRLPYGLWTCADGREVLFNRDYQPIWTRRAGEAAQAADRNEHVPHDREEWFWSDSTAPWRNKQSLSRAKAILADWQVAGCTL